MWKWIETRRGTLIDVGRVESIRVTKSDSGEFQIWIRTTSKSDYFYDKFETLEDAKEELRRLAEAINDMMEVSREQV